MLTKGLARAYDAAEDQAAEQLSVSVERSRPPIFAVALGAYALLVLIMWAPYTLYSGLPAETGFVYTSEIGSVLGGFLYRFDPLRIHTKTFYHLPYVMAEVLGIGGSYVPFQIVHSLLWWSRGFLLFLIVRRVAGDPLVAYAAGALLLVHSSDAATQWIGQMNQFGFIFWMLLAFYLFTVAAQSTSGAAAVALTVAACCSEYMSLWSYESAILLMLLFPLALRGRRRIGGRRLAGISTAWYAIPAVYLWLTIARYADVRGFAYQATVLRKNWATADLLRDWWFNVRASLEFWRWDGPALQIAANDHVPLAWVAAAIFVAGSVTILSVVGESARRDFVASTRVRGWHLLGVGFAALVLSFPVYLLLDHASGLWRTQFLSGVGTALVFTGLVIVALSYVRSLRPVGTAVALTLAASVVVWFGSLAAIDKGAAQRRVWERHRASIARILTVAPSVKPNTIIVLINVPRSEDPFSHHMWLDLAVRLAYPGVPVAATYFYADHTPSPGSNLRVDGHRWKWDGTGFTPLVQETSLANTVVVDAGSPAQPLVRSFPGFLCKARCATEIYNPDAVIAGPISPRAVRRYQLDGRF
jgi:hypothetical protein